MRIALVNPPFDLEKLLGRTNSMGSVMNIIQPLGIAYLAAVLQNDNHDVKIYDCQCENIKTDQLIHKLKKDSPEMIGLTATTPVFSSAVNVAKSVRENFPNTCILIGGSHVTALPEMTMNFNCFDFGVIGEGEITTSEIAKHLESGDVKKMKKIHGIAFKNKKKIIKTSPRSFIKNLDDIPFPARHLLPPLEKYRPTPASYVKLPQGQIMTSRGCPLNCIFCDKTAFGAMYRCRSVKNVFDEIEELINVYGMKDLKFFDDTFTTMPSRVNAICEEFKKRHIDIDWCCLTRTDMISKRMLMKMRNAGCWQVLFGLESMDQHVLTCLKGTTVEQNIRAVKLAHEVGLSVRADFLFGTPFDSTENMNKTLRMAIQLNMDFAHFNKFTPYPGSHLYRMLVEKGLSFDFENFPSQLDHSRFAYVPSYLTEQEFEHLLNEAYKRYYLRPRYIAKQLFKIRNLESIKRFINGFLAVNELKD